MNLCLNLLFVHLSFVTSLRSFDSLKLLDRVWGHCLLSFFFGDLLGFFLSFDSFVCENAVSHLARRVHVLLILYLGFLLLFKESFNEFLVKRLRR